MMATSALELQSAVLVFVLFQAKEKINPVKRLGNVIPQNSAQKESALLKLERKKPANHLKTALGALAAFREKIRARNLAESISV